MRSAAVFALSVTLAASAYAAPKPTATKPPASAPAAPAAPVAPKADFTAIDARIASGDWQGAADDLAVILNDPAQASQHAAAWDRLGTALTKGQLRYAALVAWAEALKLSPRAVTASYPALLDAVEAFGEGVWAGGLLAQDMGAPPDAAARARTAFYAARYHFAQENWGPALAMLALVNDNDAQGLDARVLRGVTLAQQGRFEDALNELSTARDQASGRDDHFRNLLDLNLARTYYALGNFGRAMEFYGRVERADSSWPEAHFERAWAHYQVNDMAGTLGLLMTHDSPFFADWYLPEAQLLRAQALFMMCKFPDAGTAIDRFEAQYKPVLGTLRGQLGKVDPKAAFADVDAAANGNTTRLPASLLQRFVTDARVRAAADGVVKADEDLARLKGLSGRPFAAKVIPLLQARRDARIDEEGGRVLTHAREAELKLADMLESIALTRIDLLTFQASLYEQAARTGQMAQMGDGIGELRKLRRKGKQVWPFQGEYWADEVGWYRVTARPDCPAEFTSGE